MATEAKGGGSASQNAGGVRAGSLHSIELHRHDLDWLRCLGVAPVASSLTSIGQSLTRHSMISELFSAFGEEPRHPGASWL